MFERRSLRPSQPIIVHTLSGLSFFGYIKALAKDVIILHSARSLPDLEPLAGDVDIPWKNYSWSQRGFDVEKVLPRPEPEEEGPEVPILSNLE